MQNSNDIKQEEKRIQKAKDVLVTFPLAKEGNYKAFNVIDENGNLKYDGNVEPNPSITDDCKCPSFTNNNNSKTEGLYSDTHGFAFQCKHIIASRDEVKKIFQSMIDEIDKKLDISTHHTFNGELDHKGFVTK